jgi:DNA-binding response OmpR family regulator
MYKGRKIALSRTQHIIFAALAAKKGKLVSKDSFVNELYGLDPNGGPDDPINVLDVCIHRIRAKLPPEIGISAQWGLGYYLSYGGPEAYMHPTRRKSSPMKYVRKRVA